MKIFYSDGYYADIGGHPFRMDKFGMIRDRLGEKEGMSPMIVEPLPARDEDVFLVHAPEYVEKLKKGALSPSEIMRLELPYSREIVEASWLWTGGSIMAMRCAVEEGVGINLAGGFHHAFPDHGEGFCVLNDIAIGIRKNQKDGLLDRALIVDCDLHQGNGTAAIFRGDNSVFTFSIHQENNYPFYKPKSDLDIGLRDGIGDDEYMDHLSANLPGIVSSFKPDLIVYVAGADPYVNDQLGGLSLSMEGLKKRDELVFSFCRRNIPVAALLAGGYAIDVEETVQIHYNMIMEAVNARGGGKGSQRRAGKS